MALLAFLLLRPYQLQNSGLMYADDDEDYFAHATAIAFGNFPDYSQEYFSRGADGTQTVPMGSIGSGLMAAPFVAAFSVIDRALDHPIIEKRDRAGVESSWSAFGFILSTQVYFWLAVGLLLSILMKAFGGPAAERTFILSLAAQGVPLYLYRRPIFSHVYEFFLQSALLAACFHRERLRTIRGPVLVGVLAGLIALTRNNNALVALLAPFLVFGLDRGSDFSARIKRILSTAFVAMLIDGVFKGLPLLANKATEPYAFLASKLAEPMGILGFLNRVGHMFWGFDWGILFLAPFCLVGLAVLIASIVKGNKLPLQGEIMALTCAVGVNIYLVARLGTQGGWYGYRNVLFSWIPLMVVPMASWLKELESRPERERRIIFWLLGLLAVQPLLSMLMFDGNNTNLTLRRMETVGWGNPTYQLEIWRTILWSPSEAAIALFKGGPLYLIYGVSVLFGMGARLPSLVLERYPVFDVAVLIKSVLLYGTPFMAFLLLRRFIWKENPSGQGTPGQR